MTTESRSWRLAKLAAVRDEAAKRLELAVRTMRWRDAMLYAQQAAEADEAIAALAADLGVADHRDVVDCSCDNCRRRRARIAEEMAAGEQAFYILSFNEGGTFRGACVIRAYGPAHAFDEACRLKIQDRFTTVSAVKAPADQEVPEGMLGRLLTDSEFAFLGMGKVDLETGEIVKDPGRAQA